MQTSQDELRGAPANSFCPARAPPLRRLARAGLCQEGLHPQHQKLLQLRKAANAAAAAAVQQYIPSLWHALLLLGAAAAAAGAKGSQGRRLLNGQSLQKGKCGSEAGAGHLRLLLLGLLGALPLLSWRGRHPQLVLARQGEAAR